MVIFARLWPHISIVLLCLGDERLRHLNHIGFHLLFLLIWQLIPQSNLLGLPPRLSLSQDSNHTLCYLFSDPKLCNSYLIDWFRLIECHVVIWLHFLLCF
jgi:hypothetical protein